MDKAPWLFLEPYVHLLRQNNTLLVYNTLSKVALEFNLPGRLSQLVGELTDPGNGYVVPVTPDLMLDPDVQEFINQVRGHFMGDLLDPSWSEGKPVNLIPEPVVKHGLTPPPTQASQFLPGIDVRNYLQEITFFLNRGPGALQGPFAHAAYQFSYPDLPSETEAEMNPDLFRSMLDDVNQYAPTLIHLSGRNLFLYPHLEQVISSLASSPFQKKYHILADGWNDQIVPFLLIQKNTSLAVYVTFPAGMTGLAGHLASLPDPKMLKKIEFNLVLRNMEELQMAQEMIRLLELTNLYFKPLYTGENLGFFRENVFVSREDILASQPDQRQVFSRISVNENDFGKFSVLPGGEVHANLIDPAIGHASTHNLADLVGLELKQGISWRRSRKGVSPCGGCLYQFLCPPISSYEIFMKRFNFCDVYPTGEAS